MHVDEPESGRRGLKHGIEPLIAHAIVRFEHARHQVDEVRRTGTDEFRQRIGAAATDVLPGNHAWPANGGSNGQLMDKG